jgi:hypothetical protein
LAAAEDFTEKLDPWRWLSAWKQKIFYTAANKDGAAAAGCAQTPGLEIFETWKIIVQVTSPNQTSAELRGSATPKHAVFA